MHIFRAIRGGSSYANVVATVAMFIALGGTSYAAILITGANIKDGTITSRDIANGRYGIQSADVKNGSLGLVDISTTAKASLRGQAGPQGIPGQLGPTGPSGATGNAGPPGANGTTIVARTRSTSTSRTADVGDVNVPLTGNSWTQAASEVDWGGLGGTVTFTPPNVPGGCSDGNGLGSLLIVVYVNGAFFAGESASAPMDGVPRTMPIMTGFKSLFEPGADTARTATVTISDTCVIPGDNFDVTDLRFDIAGTR